MKMFFESTWIVSIVIRSFFLSSFFFLSLKLLHHFFFFFPLPFSEQINRRVGKKWRVTTLPVSFFPHPHMNIFANGRAIYLHGTLSCISVGFAGTFERKAIRNCAQRLEYKCIRSAECYESTVNQAECVVIQSWEKWSEERPLCRYANTIECLIS